jgi:hypothetical protein
MTLHWILAVRKDKKGRVKQVQWGNADGVRNTIAGIRTVATASEVASVIEWGDDVMTLLRPNKWSSVPGARVKRTLNTRQGEWIATEEPENHAGGTLDDLPGF